jgi:hypothetical protein
MAVRTALVIIMLFGILTLSLGLPMWRQNLLRIFTTLVLGRHLVADIERTNLDAHVSLCELRYQALERRLELVESQLGDLHTLVLEIRDSLAQLPAGENTRWLQAQAAVIAVLVSAVAWLAARLWT